ncbi:hypothetical protein SPFM15_00116 [Salmonella phage SPFM15]|nr:hypothetical protein SPFM5_00111 [Salmonella phage SPFM5]VFR13740.1 hypothetical protein SPFM15_00116 [Salmonella phage SPFM15]
MVKEGHADLIAAGKTEDAFALSELTIAVTADQAEWDTDEEVLAFVNTGEKELHYTRLDSSNIIGANSGDTRNSKLTITATAESANFSPLTSADVTFGAVADYSPAEVISAKDQLVALFNAANSGLSVVFRTI